MSVILELRAKLAADLAGEVPVLDGWPDRPQAPALLLVPPTTGDLIGPGDPATFERGRFALSVEVICIASQPQPVEAAEQQVLSMVEFVLYNSAGDWTLLGASTPGVIRINNVDHLGAVVRLRKGFSV
jgi:hypothetical protein